MSLIIACVGSRWLPKQSLDICIMIGTLLAEMNAMVSTGAAMGADQAFARGCLENGGTVFLWLPWRRFERPFVREMEEAHEGRVEVQSLSRVDEELQQEAAESLDHLPYGKTALSPMGSRLQQRNWLIVRPAHAVIAFPGTRQESGGTRQAMRLGRHRGIEVLDLPEESWVDRHLIEQFVEKLMG
jgi:predicted Rossmann-fold nucleotide-binding protein